jgi:hypothetical protein
MIFNWTFNATALQTGFIYHTIFLICYSLFFYFFGYFLFLLGLTTSIFNLQFILLFFGYFLLILSKNL